MSNYRTSRDGLSQRESAFGGRLIALVGTSSVGKSSVARRLQELLPEPHLVVGLG
ncbi:hypothetical protein [Nocardioides sp. NPDC006273]|uniref:phosphotransferase-like protein n=1 Tax=Nocardioides sp. NPDC006273 TaxID=3155598 RepID=UPI0033B4F66E